MAQKSRAKCLDKPFFACYHKHKKGGGAPAAAHLREEAIAMNKAMQALRDIERQLFALGYAEHTIHFDDATAAPRQSYPGRGQALGALAEMRHRLLTGSGLPALLREAEAGGLDAQQAAEVREMRRLYDETACIPADEYAAFSQLISDAQNVWQAARADNDFAAFAPWLERILEARRRMAGALDPGKAPYDVWLDRYEPGMTMEKYDAFFALLKGELSALVRAVGEAEPVRDDFLSRAWPLGAQRALSRELMRRIGLDEGHVALAESAHPFTIELYNGDVRITTHYHEHDMTSNMFSVIHEGGHALYELHTGDALRCTVLASGSSMGIHEGQSRLFENYFGRSRAFLAGLWPRLRELFPAQLADVTCEEFYRAVNRCVPGLIRIHADEATYSLHILIRYELEKQLFDGTLSVSDLPAAWNEKYREYLGVVPASDSEGVLQDIHWAGGMFGYFPSYALGSAIAAQVEAHLRGIMDLDGALRSGSLGDIRSYLKEHLHQYGGEKKTNELLLGMMGEPFQPGYYIQYLKNKFGE